jgi:hypothetical protein
MAAGGAEAAAAAACAGRAGGEPDDDSHAECWICLSGGGDLCRPCACKMRPVHAACLARWQLVRAGQRCARARGGPRARVAVPTPSAAATGESAGGAVAAHGF